MATDLHTAANRLLKAWDLNDLIHEHIEALRQALANEALDKMAENARELGLDYEPAQPKYRRGDRLICLETEEYCVIHISGTDRQWVKFPDTHIGVYKNEQLAELFELLPKEIEIEQPAQQEQYIGETNVELGFYSDDASNGQQRELVGKVEMGQLVGNRPHESTSNPDTEREIAVITGVDEHGPMLGWFKHWINYPVGTKLYTSPPAQRTWVGLTEEEIEDAWQGLMATYIEEVDSSYWAGCDFEFARAIEAKLRSKNEDRN